MIRQIGPIALATIALASCTSVGQVGAMTRPSADPGAVIREAHPYHEIGPAKGTACRYFVLGSSPGATPRHRRRWRRRSRDRWRRAPQCHRLLQPVHLHPLLQHLHLHLHVGRGHRHQLSAATHSAAPVRTRRHAAPTSANRIEVRPSRRTAAARAGEGSGSATCRLADRLLDGLTRVG